MTGSWGLPVRSVTSAESGELTLGRICECLDHEATHQLRGIVVGVFVWLVYSRRPIIHKSHRPATLIVFSNQLSYCRARYGSRYLSSANGCPQTSKATAKSYLLLLTRIGHTRNSQQNPICLLRSLRLPMPGCSSRVITSMCRPVVMKGGPD